MICAGWDGKGWEGMETCFLAVFSLSPLDWADDR